MKKHAYILALTLLLCGCSQNRTESKETAATTPEPTAASVETTETAEITTEYVSEVDLNTTVEYGSFDGFLRSDFCKEMLERGYTPYDLSYDEANFEFKGMHSSGSFYEMGFRNKMGEKGVSCSICYGPYETVSDLSVNKWDTSGDSIVTVEKDGTSYDVYISKTPFIDYDEYTISYIPFEGYKMSIYAGATTPEAALAYIHEFDLVPADAQESTSEEIPAETSAE